MLTLGIETSCDETACSVLKGRDTILSNIISSSLFRHQPFGGVVPEIASRHSLEQIDTVFRQALKEAKIRPSDLDLIAVTKGPGLIGSLLIGISFAKALSYQLKIPLVGVNHLEAHLVANFIGEKPPARFVGLLVSGGHTSLSYHDKGRVEMVGSTVDDAVGEAFDKVAKILGLGYPGGPVIDKLARQGNPEAFRFTRPKQENEFDFSFSGVKTAVLYLVRDQCRGEVSSPAMTGRGDPAPTDVNFVRDVAASFQRSAVRWLVEKSLALAHRKKVRDIIVGGGVSANSELRETLTREGKVRDIRVWFPRHPLSLDNGAMIARRGMELFKTGKKNSYRLTALASLKMG